MTQKNIDEILKKSLSGEQDANETLKSEVLSKMKNTNKNPIKFTKIFRNTAAVAACFVLCIGVAANVSSKAYSVLKEVPLISNLTEVLTFRAYENVGDKASAQIDKPVIPEYENINKQVDEYIQKIINDYTRNSSNMTGESLGETDRYDMTTDYTILGDSEEYLSFIIRTSIVMAGTSQEDNYFVVDKKTGDRINFSHLFSTDEEKSEIKQLIIESMNQSDIKYDTKNAVIDNQTSFYIDKDGQIYVCFERGHVAARAYGSQKFIIGSAKSGETKLFTKAIAVKKVEGTIAQVKEFNLFTIEDFNGNKHEISSLGSIITGENLESGNYVTVEYTGVTKGVIEADIIEVFKI